MSSKLRHALSRPVFLGLLVVLLAQMTQPGIARAAPVDVYVLGGYEVWFTPTVGRFVGAGYWTGGELSAWYSSIEHTVSVSPTGRVTGGWATLYRSDGVWISGTFSDGIVEQTNDGPGCTNETHTVTGVMYDVTRSDSAGSNGAGIFDATLTHYRTWLFGYCMAYSASVAGTVTVAFEDALL